MDVRVEAAGGQDLALAGDHLGARPDDDVDARLDVGVAGLADPLDAAVLQPDVGLDDPPVIEDEGVGDDGVDGAVGVRRLRLPHAVADDLAAAELHLLAVGGEVALDLDHEVRVGKAQRVADGRPEHVGISGAREREGHGGEPQAVRGAKPGSRAASRSKVIVTSATRKGIADRDQLIREFGTVIGRAHDRVANGVPVFDDDVRMFGDLSKSDQHPVTLPAVDSAHGPGELDEHDHADEGLLVGGIAIDEASGAPSLRGVVVAKIRTRILVSTPIIRPPGASRSGQPLVFRSAV